MCFYVFLEYWHTQAGRLYRSPPFCWDRLFSYDWQSWIRTARIKPINQVKLGDKKERKKIYRGSKFNWEHKEKIEVKKYSRPLAGCRAVGKWGLAGFRFGRLHKFTWNDCRSEVSVRPVLKRSEIFFRWDCVQPRTAFTQGSIKVLDITNKHRKSRRGLRGHLHQHNLQRFPFMSYWLCCVHRRSRWLASVLFPPLFFGAPRCCLRLIVNSP